MAYRRKQGIQRSATFVEDHRQPSPGDSASPATASPRATRFADDSRRPDRSLAAQTLLASAARGDMQALAEHFTASSSSPRAARPSDPVTSSSLRVSPRAARPADPATSSSLRVSPRAGRPNDPITSSSPRVSPRSGRQNDLFAQDPVTMLYTSTSSGANDDSKRSPLKKDETKQGLWGLLAQQAKVMLEENAPTEDARNQPLATSAGSPQAQSRWSYDRVRKSESPTFQNGAEGPKFDMGGHIKNALEASPLVNSMEGLHAATMAESRTPAVVGRKLHIRRKTCSVDMRGAHMKLGTPEVMSPMMTDFESPQIKASRDVANVMAAKVKLLQRELKTVNADLAFSKERCTQLEEENRLHRAGNHDHAANEDLIRKQLETLLAEKARLATENTVYARENRFLREIVDLNQLTVVGLQEDIIEEEEEEYEEEEEEEDAIEEAEQDTPGTPGTAPPQSPSHHTDNAPVAAPKSPSCRTDNVPVAAPKSPSRRTDNVPVAATQSPSHRTDNMPVATPQSPARRTDNVPESRSTDSSSSSNTAIGAAESPMHQSTKEDKSSPQTNTIQDNSSEKVGHD